MLYLKWYKTSQKSCNHFLPGTVPFENGLLLRNRVDGARQGSRLDVEWVFLPGFW
jgi:hypothetical protein